jgi:hypothetical protein
VEVQPAPVLHGIARIDGQIHQDLFQLTAINLDGLGEGIEIRNNLNVRPNSCCIMPAIPRMHSLTSTVMGHNIC